LRILQLHNHHASLGGAMEVLAHEGELLRGAGHDVTEYTLPAAETLGLPGWRAGAKAVWNLEAQREVSRRIAAFRPDVVHVHTPFPLMSPSVFQAAYRAGVPAVTTLHSYRYSCVVGTCVRDDKICEDCVGSRLKLAGVRHRCYHESAGATAALTLGLAVHRAAGTFHHAVTRYLTLTDFSRRLLIRDGFPADKIVVKPNSVPDPGPAPRSPQARTVLFVGRLIDLKGVHTLLDAWQQTPAGMRLVIAGDGELRPLVEERAAADPSLSFLGWVGEDEVTRLMREAEVVVVPSQWYEGLPLVILRSLSVGTPLLVSDLENFSEDVVADGVGLTFRMGDARDLAARLASVVGDPDLMNGLRASARASYDTRYSPASDLLRLEAVYSDIVR
jgi:glycosyltransferase involved in cell wall biosynthesis